MQHLRQPPYPLTLDDHSVDALRYAVHSTAYDWRHLLAHHAGLTSRTFLISTLKPRHPFVQPFSKALVVRSSSLLEIKTRSAYQLDEWLASVPDGPAL